MMLTSQHAYRLASEESEERYRGRKFFLARLDLDVQAVEATRATKFNTRISV